MTTDLLSPVHGESVERSLVPIAVVSNIQRFSIHDGPGVRTTIFFKGCPLNCLWCHNPETISFEKEKGSDCYTADDLVKKVTRDQIFFGKYGGVTVSGGEPLAQDMAFMIDFLERLKTLGINVVCDTSGDVPWEHFELVMPYVDIFLYDLKLGTDAAHKKFTGRSNKRIIENLQKLAKSKKVHLTIPVVGGVNEGNEMKEILKQVKNIAPNAPINFIPYHQLGLHKWEKLGKTPQKFYTPSKEYIDELAAEYISHPLVPA